jgi:hypothetical protein
MAGEPPRVDPLQNWDAGLGEPVAQALSRPPVRGMTRELTHNDAADLRRRGLRVLRVDPVVADHRRGHHDDLAQIAGVGERFLVAGEIGGEDDLTECRIDGSSGGTGEPAAVFEQYESWLDCELHFLG